MTHENDDLPEQIRRYAHEWNLAALDEIAAQYRDGNPNDSIRSELADAYGYHYGQLAMDYAAEKYWSGGQSQHLEDLLDRLTWLISISGDPFYLIQKSRFLREQATLSANETERQRLFVDAYALLDELLDDPGASDPTNTLARAEMVEVLTESAMFRSDRDEPLDRAADILELLLTELSDTTFEPVGLAMMYVRRLPEFPEHRRLADLTAAFDRWAEDNWARNPMLLIAWCSHYLILLTHRVDDPLFEHWYARATRIPEVTTGTEEGLSKLSYDIFGMAAELVRTGKLLAGEQCYLLSLDLESFRYGAGDTASMAWRKLHFAGFLIEFYREHDRVPEAGAVLREHLIFGRNALATHGSESSLHGSMSGLLQIGIDFVGDQERVEFYREITEHLARRIEALKEQFSDHVMVGDTEVPRYLFYVYDDDYENLIRYHLMLGHRDKAITVLREWSNLDARKREQLNYGSVDWAHLATKKEFAEIRDELGQYIDGTAR